MTTLHWLQGFAASMASPLLAWPAVGFLLWLVFAVRIGARHDASMEDFPDRGEKV